MKITSETLGEVRVALIEANASLAEQEKAATAADGARDAGRATVRGLQGAFDIAAAAYASDAELSTGQLDALPAAVQVILGHVPAKATPAKA
jgi:hypothetical protein